jgi:hypothetical protein
MKSNNNNNNDDDDDDDNNNNNNTAMGSVHARGDTFLTFGLIALTETNTSRLATGCRPYTTFVGRKVDLLQITLFCSPHRCGQFIKLGNVVRQLLDFRVLRVL